MNRVITQTRAEVTMTLRRGESLLLALGIPVLLLVFFSIVDVLPTETKDPIDFLAPGVLALAVMSTAMVGLGIATGFERDDQPTPVGVAAARPARMTQSGLALGAAVADRPHKDLDRPTYLRRMGEQRDAIERLAVSTDDEWDVPTFLRKQTD